MKKLFFILFSLLIVSPLAYAGNHFDMSLPVEGDTIANESLQFEVLKKLYPVTSKLNPVCFNHKVINTQVVHFPYDVVKKDNKYISGYWKELWTVNCCGEKVQVPIIFKIGRRSTTFLIEENLVLR